MKLLKMEMCNKISRLLPNNYQKNSCKEHGADVARRKLLVIDKTEKTDNILEIGKARREGYNLLVTANQGTELIGANTIDGVIIIPEGITHIKKDAFDYSRDINMLFIPSTVTTIEEMAMYPLKDIRFIQVHPDNKSFVVIGGVLYSTDMTRVIKATNECMLDDLPNSIKQIDPYAFAYCKTIEKLVIPHSVTGVGEGAFHHSSIRTICFHNKLETLKRDVLSECSDLIRVEMPKGLSRIERRAFAGCTRFRDVKLPSTLRVIDDFAFENCKNVESVSIGRELEHIAPTAFVGCDSLKKYDVAYDNEHFMDESGVLYNISGDILYRVPSNYRGAYFTVEDSVQIIAPHAFDGCKDIRNVDFPKSLLLIGESAFYECEDLEQVVLPESVLRIEAFAFKNCKSLNTISLNKSIRSIELESFANCTALCSLSLKDTNIINIEESAFSGCKRLEHVDFPETLLAIEACAFEDCRIEELHIPSSVKSMDEYAFFLNNTIRNLSVHEDNRVYQAENGVLYDNATHILKMAAPRYPLGDYTVKEGTLDIYDNAFYECENLQSIKIPSSVNYIGSNAFYGCSNLLKVDSKANISYLSESIFENCSALQHIKIPQTVTKIGMHAFSGCSSLKEIKLPKKLECIGGHAFEGCKSIRKIDVPNSVSDLSRCTFMNCISLKTVSLPKNLKIIENQLFKGCLLLQKIQLPQSLISIQYQAFCGCESLDEIVIPSQVQIIGSQTFCGCCNLQKVVLSDALKELGEFCFLGCNQLETIIFKNTNVKGIDVKCMDGIDRNRCTVYVPKGGSNAFNRHPAFEGFKIVEMK